MGMIADVELWNGNKRVAEELKGNVEAGMMFLGPRGKIPDNLDKSVQYTAATRTAKWTVRFQAFDDVLKGATFFVVS